MVDHLDRDAPVRGLVKRPRGVAVQRSPGFLVDLGFQSRLERLVRIVRPKKIGVANEEALFVVVGIDEPAGDPVRAVAPDLAGIGMEYVDTVHLDLDLARGGGKDVDIWFAEDDEKVALASVFQVV